MFSTSGLPFLFKLWHAPLIRALSRKGFDVLGDFHCRGHDSWGPLWLAGGINKHHPDGRDLERASQFAAGISRKVWHDDVRQEASPKTFEMATLVSESIKP